MRKIILLQVLLASLQACIFSQPSVPYSTSSVRGSTIVTNYYDPNAGPSTGPGLPISPLESRLYGPLTPWAGSTATPSGTIPAYTSAPTSTFVPSNFTTSPASAFTPLSSTGAGYPSTVTGYPASSAFPATSAVFSPTGSLAPSGAYASTVPPLGPRGTGNSLTIPVGQPTTIRPNQPLMPVAASQPGLAAPGIAMDPTYFFPGLVRFYIDHWVGSDYLYNMPPAIGVVVEVIQPSDIPNIVNTDVIKTYVSEFFSNMGISPFAETVGDLPPLPFFHLVIFITPVEDLYVFTMSGRYFEEVKLARLDFSLPGTFQGITWERQEMVVASLNRLSEQLLSTAGTIANMFIQKITSYRRQLLEQGEQLRLRCGPYPTVKCRVPKSTL